ncbi:MAG: PilZ domain-containing protein [Vulcanimicrobiota bacterium]
MDRRKFSRVNVNLQVEVTDGRMSLIGCETRDLSLRGVFVYSDVIFSIGCPCLVTITLTGMVVPIEIKLKAKVVRAEENGIGVEFESSQDLESYHHLRNLVMYNSLTPEQIVDEEKSARFAQQLD